MRALRIHIVNRRVFSNLPKLDNLEIKYNGEDVRLLHQQLIFFWNPTHHLISREHLSDKDPLRVVWQNGTVFTSRILKQTSPAIDAVISNSGSGNLFISLDHLAQNQGFVVEIFHDGKIKSEIAGTIKGFDLHGSLRYINRDEESLLWKIMGAFLSPKPRNRRFFNQIIGSTALGVGFILFLVWIFRLTSISVQADTIQIDVHGNTPTVFVSYIPISLLYIVMGAYILLRNQREPPENLAVDT